MTPLEEKAGSLSRDEIVALLVSQQELSERTVALSARNAELEQQLDWFKRQLFGSKSERRPTTAVDGEQLFLGGEPAQVTGSAPSETVQSYVRRQSRDIDAAAEETPLRFDPSVPVEEIRLPNPAIEGLSPDQYDIVGEKVTERLAQKRGSYVVLRYVRQVVKLKASGTFACPQAPPSVLEKSFADVSLLVGILIDKFRFHLPLYRQHQRLLAAGIRLDRSTLTQWVHRTVALLEPIYDAKMKTGFFWPILGDRSEIVFPFSRSRAHAVAREFLGGFAGVLLTDGYEAYDRYAAQVAEVVHALCWSHYLESDVIRSTC